MELHSIQTSSMDKYGMGMVHTSGSCNVHYVIGKRGWKVYVVFWNTDNEDKLCLHDTKQSIIGEHDVNINVYLVWIVVMCVCRVFQVIEVL